MNYKLARWYHSLWIWVIKPIKDTTTDKKGKELMTITKDLRRVGNTVYVSNIQYKVTKTTRHTRIRNVK